MFNAARIGCADGTPPRAFIGQRHLRLTEFVGQRNHGSAGVPQRLRLIPAMLPHQAVEPPGTARKRLHRVAGQRLRQRLVGREQTRRQAQRMAAPGRCQAKRAPQHRGGVQARQQQRGGAQVRPASVIEHHSGDARWQIRRSFKQHVTHAGGWQRR